MAPISAQGGVFPRPKEKKAGAGGERDGVGEATPLVVVREANAATGTLPPPPQSPPAPLLSGADPEMAAAFEEGAWVSVRCVSTRKGDYRTLGPVIYTHNHHPFPHPHAPTVTASRPRRVLLTSLLALGLLVLAGLLLARLEGSSGPAQGLDGACSTYKKRVYDQ